MAEISIVQCVERSGHFNVNVYKNKLLKNTLNAFNKENSFGDMMSAILEHKAFSGPRAHSLDKFHLDSEMRCKNC